MSEPTNTQASNETENPEAQPATSSAEKPQAAKFVTFIHPDGRELSAAVVTLDADEVAELVVFEGDTGPFGGTRTFIGVPHVEPEEGGEPTRASWHN